MKKTLVIAAAVTILSSTFASAQMMMMDQGGKKMTQEQMNDMARARPIPGAGFTGPTPNTMAANSNTGSSMSHKKMRHSKKMKSAM